MHGAFAQEHRALCQPRHIVKGVHFFDGLFFQKCGAHGAAFARLFRMLENEVHIARRAPGAYAAGQGRQCGRVAVVPAFVRHARAARGIGQAVFLLNGQRVDVRPEGDAPRAGAPAAVHRIEPCPAVRHVQRRRVFMQKLLQHALRARFPARQLGRGMQRMAQRHSLFVQFIIHSAASPKFIAAAITVCQHFSTRRPL